MIQSNALRQGLRILELFQGHGVEAMTFSEILVHLDAPRSSTFRLVGTLQELGYLRRDEGKRYWLGSRVMRLGFSFLASSDIVDLARPELLRLRAAMDCATYLAILEETEIVCLAAYPTRRRTPAILTVGTRFPAHLTPMGRMLLAHQPSTYVADHYPAREAEGLCAVLRSDRERGYVISHSQVASGIASVAAPVLNSAGSAVGAISAGAPDLSIPKDDFDTQIRDAVIASARAISALLS